MAMAEEEVSVRRIFPRRYLILVLSFFALFHTTLLRANLSMAIVAMTSNYSITDINGSVTYYRDLEWDLEDQGVLLGSFFYGFFATQMLGGILAHVVGGGRLVGLAILVSSVSNLISPIVAYSGLVPFIILRSLLGLTQGVVFPAIHELWSHWAPPLESTKLLGITYSGAYIGTVGSMCLSGIIAKYLGWTWIFYIFGSTGIVWCITWFAVVKEHPSLDTKITANELEYLSSTIEQTRRLKFADTPWRSILTSVPIWATILACTTESYTFFLLMTQLPIYLNDVTNLNLEDVGFLAAMPYLGMALTAQFNGVLADMLRSKYKITTTSVRKISTCGAYFVQAIVLFLLGYVNSLAASMACLITTLAVSGFSSFTLVQQSTHWNSLKSQCELTSITMCQDQLFRSGSSVRQLNHRPLQHHIHHDRLHQSGSDQFHCQEQVGF